MCTLITESIMPLLVLQAYSPPLISCVLFFFSVNVSVTRSADICFFVDNWKLKKKKKKKKKQEMLQYVTNAPVIPNYDLDPWL